MSNKSLLKEQLVIDKIYEIRGERVMLDRDLAELYGVETKYLKRQVRRNKLRFPEDFMFELTIKELENWRSQFGTSNSDKMGLRYLPYAFTETGVAQLSAVLNSDRAILINNQIMRVFIKMRSILSDNLQLKLDVEKIKKKLENQDKNIELVFSYLDELIEKQENPKPRKQIGYKSKT
ncbi:MAG: ORF6N domain-containing protein [Flavobacteriales bacterium]|nr:ORF6N domain-containing protein [Flavobacteriales bacterium]